MRSTIICALLLGSLLTVNAQYNEKNLALEPAVRVSKYTYANLQFYPIRANSVFVKHHKSVGRYVTLKDGLANKKVVVSEVGTGRSDGEVNTLFIENVSKDTVMVLAGEVVQGGKQDRMIAQDFILYPRSGKKDVSVFCVEHGRWTPKEDGKVFNKCYAIPSNEVRKAATVEKNQGKVWDKVAEVTTKNKAQSSTGTLSALQTAPDYTGDLNKYTEFFAGLLAKEDDVIGLVAISGNKVLGCDMFATHELFKSHYSNLVHSYASEAITSGAKPQINYDEVKKYVQNILADENKQETEIQKNGSLLKDGKQKLHISTF